MDDQDLVASEILRLADSGIFDPRFFGPISEAAVAGAERDLSLTFPRSFRIFLRYFGAAAMMLGYRFAGLPDLHQPSERMPEFDHVVDATKRQWSRGVPTHFIYVTSDGGDYCFFLDASKRDEQDMCPVVVYGPGAEGVVVAADFLDFLRKLASDTPRLWPGAERPPVDEQERIAREILRLVGSGDHRPYFFGPVSDGAIAAAEHELGITFPRSYQAFIRHFGAGAMLSYDFDGLPDNPHADEMPQFSHVVDTTKSAWKGVCGHGMPTYLICVTEDGGDYHFYFDTTKRDERGECPVVVYGPGADGIVVAEDFLDFVRKLANDDPLF